MPGVRKRKCPECEGALLRIVFGYPTPETSEAARRGEFALGGCVMWGDGRDATHVCTTCERRFILSKNRLRPWVPPDLNESTGERK
jgi:hypothetical protein